MTQPSASRTVQRRFAGPLADELTILCRPEGGSLHAAAQAAAIYGDLAAALAGHRASFVHLTSETLHLRDVRRDLPNVLEARARVLADLGQTDAAPRPTAIQQAPDDAEAAFHVVASAVVPHRGDDWSVRDVPATPACGCDGCTRCGARLVRLGEQTSLHASNVHGNGGDVLEQAWNMFRAAERLLAQCGMTFRDVVRTWIYLRDIDRDYRDMNRARREFFADRGIARRPASTGVAGAPYPDAHDVTLCLSAVTSTRPLEATGISTPTLNEAWEYGADFSRGLRLTELNKVALHVSGTASIDELGRTIHVGDVTAQADRMVHNIASLLAVQGAGFDDVVSAVTYVKHAGDAAALRSVFRARGFDGFPCAIVEATLCRPELLCEAEAVAMLPVRTEA